MSLIYFILVAFGLTQIIVYGTILDSIRPVDGKVGLFFSCPMCVGFWVGALLWSLNCYTTLFTFDYSPVTAIMLGFLSSGTSYVLNMIFGDSGVRISSSI